MNPRVRPPSKRSVGWMDTLYSFLSNLGTDKDKVFSTKYQVVLMMPDQLEAAYRGDWIARKIIDVPAQDATREWRQWHAEQDQIEALEENEKKLDLRRKLEKALTKARLYGGSALVLGVEGNPEEELIPDKVGKDQLKYVHVLTKNQITTGQIIYDVDSPFYGEPEYYQRTQNITQKGLPQSQIKIHPSRVIRLVGAPYPDELSATDAWGDSVLQVVDDAVRAAGMTAGGIAALIQEAKVDVIKIPNFTRKITNKEFADRLTTRFAYANSTKSIINALILDKDEDWERINADFSGLPDILKMYLLIASGAADIPATRMLGQSPAGLSATGESDIRNYYDNVASHQENELRPTLSRLDEVLIRSTFGSRDPNIYYEWNPLWQMSELEKADLAGKKANAAKIDTDTGLIPADALAEARLNQLIEDGTYPGLEEAIDAAALMAEYEIAHEHSQLELEGKQQEIEAGPPQKALPAPGDAVKDGLSESELNNLLRRLLRGNSTLIAELKREIEQQLGPYPSEEDVRWLFGIRMGRDSAGGARRRRHKRPFR